MLAALIGHLPLWQMYLTLAVASGILMTILSGLFYIPFYVRNRDPTWKTQERFPLPSTIRREIQFAFIGLMASVSNPTLATWLQANGYNKLYTNVEDYGWGYTFLSWVGIFLINEVFQWWWHRECHLRRFLWEFHKLHHNFSNPSPISVIANHPIDIWVQSSPLLWLPFLFPMHDLALYGNYTIIAYCYGAYLHGGFDWPQPVCDPHNKYIVTAWHHNHHHHYGKFGKPINTGFVFQIVDKIGGTFEGPPTPAKEGGPCICPHCRNWKKKNDAKDINDVSVNGHTNSYSNEHSNGRVVSG